MQAVGLPSCSLRTVSLPALDERFNRKFIFSDKEIADGALLFASRRDLVCSSPSSIRPEGNRRGRPPRRNTASNKAANMEKQPKVPERSDGEISNPSNQEEIIALFRRIQTSISKGGSLDTKESSSDDLKEKESADLVLEVLRQFPSKNVARGMGEEQNKGVRAEGSKRKGSRRKNVIEEDSQTGDFKLLRPQSNFIKRSPIPSSTPKEKIGEVIREGLPAPTADITEGSKLERVEEMKLPELKELARSKGVKGFSKLKKGELVELLKGLLQT